MSATAPRHPFELVLEQLTGRMGVRNGWGWQEDAEPNANAKARLVWVPPEKGAIEYGPPLYRIPHTETIATQLCNFDVSFHVGSALDVYDKHCELAAWLDVIVGPKMGSPPSRDGVELEHGGYEIGAVDFPKDGPPVCRVTLKRQVVRRYLPLRAVTSAPLGVVVTDKAFENPETVVPAS